MVDPLSVTGVVLQIAAVATKVYAYGLQLKDAKKEIRELLVEILALKAVLEQFETVQDASSLLSSPQGRDALSATNSLLDTILESLEEKQGRARRTMQLLAWPQNKPAIQSHIARLERMKTYFSLLLMNDRSALGQEIVTAIKQIAINFDEDLRRNRKNEQDKVYREIKNWISPVNSTLIHRRALSTRHPGTGIWFLKGSFQKWIDPAQDEIQILCITGTSGCGKTTLCSAAIEEARSITADSNLHCVVYFHCSFEICSSRQLETILGSFVAQLSDHVPKILEDLKRDYERPNTPTTNDLIQILTKHAKSMEKIYMFLDAVNESEHVETVARAMRDLLKHTENIRLMITCTTRPKAFDSSTELKIEEVTLSTQILQTDIASFVASQVDSREEFYHLSELHKEHMKLLLVEKADGMFRYAQCQLDYLSSQYTGRFMLRALEQMPEDLNGVYRAILLRIPLSDRELVREALLWLSLALEPLTLAALSDAVVLEENDYALNNESRLPNPQVLLNMCQGLIAYDKETTKVSLAHSTVRTFLACEGISSGPLAIYHINYATSQRTIYRKCLAYILLDDFERPCRDWEGLKERYAKFPLLRYAAQNWPLHFNLWTSARRQTLGEMKGEMKRVMSFFRTHELAKGGNYTSWVQTLLSEAPPKTSLTTEPLYYAASFGLQPVVEKLWETNAKIDAKGGRAFSTPLLAACFRGHPSIVRILLEAGADPNSTNGGGISCIYFARDFDEIKNLLCEYGAKDYSQCHRDEKCLKRHIKAAHPTHGKIGKFDSPCCTNNFSHSKRKAVAESTSNWTCCACGSTNPD